MITLRVDEEIELALDRVSRVQGISRSELVRRAITVYLSKYEKPSAYDLGSEVFGQFGSGGKNLSEKRKDELRRGAQEKWNG